MFLVRVFSRGFQGFQGFSKGFSRGVQGFQGFPWVLFFFLNVFFLHVQNLGLLKQILVLFCCSVAFCNLMVIFVCFNCFLPAPWKLH